MAAVTGPSTKELRENRAKLATQMREMTDKMHAENRDFSAEEDANWKRINDDYEKLSRKIELIGRTEEVEKQQREVVGDAGVGREDRESKPGEQSPPLGESRGGSPSEEHRALALQAWCRVQSDLDIDERHEEACRAVGIKPHARDYRFSLMQNNDYRRLRSAYRDERALSAFVNTAGAYTVPQGFINQLEVALLLWNGVRSVADVLRTDQGNDLPWPTVNDTSNKGSILVESQAVSTSGPQPLFGQLILHAYKYTSGLVQVPTELLQDSAFDLSEYLASALGIRIGRIQADHFTTGDGAGKPNGVATAATVGVTTTSPTAIASDELYNLKHSVDPAYRPGAGWMMHDQILLAIKKLKDSYGRYLWQSSLAGGIPDTIDNDPLTINQSMANSVAANNLTLLYGNFKKYKVRDVAEIRMLRLVERYADQDMTGFVMFTRSDGNLIDAGTHPVKSMQQHS